MMYEIDGIGWVRADQIALAKGMPMDSPERIEANIHYQLSSMAEEGHTWITPPMLITAVLSSLNLGAEYMDQFRACLHSMHAEEKIWWNDEKTMIALSYLRDIEERIAGELFRLSNGERKDSHPNYLDELAVLEKTQGWEFTDEQKRAIDSVLVSNVNIISGGAGTGKSSVVGGVLKLLPHLSFAQCALSGRAAARLTEVTHKEGQTIHRLLGYQWGEFTRNKHTPLQEEIIILDEVSMVGAEIFLHLLEAIPTGAKLIMLGDEGQLESIGLCNVFKDMLDSGVIQVNHLTKIHRQAAKSAIITESVKVRNQEPL